MLRAAPLVESLRELADNTLALDDSDQLARQLLAILKANPGLSWVSYGDARGTFTGVYRPVEGGMGINQSWIDDGKTQLREHDVLSDGKWELSRTDDDSGYDPRNRPFYQKASERRRLVWLPPYVFFSQGIPGISCSAPVYDNVGQLRGVVSIDFDLKALSEFVAALSVSERSQIFLFTSDEVLLAHPNQRSLAPKGQGADGRLLALADAGDHLIDAFRAKMPTHRFDAVAAADEPKSSADNTDTKNTDKFDFFEFDHDGAEYLASTTAFRVGDDLVWVVGAVAPKSDFLAGVWQSQAVALAVAAAAIGVAMLLAAALANRVSGPVVSLIGFMRRVGDGDLNAKADFGGSREFRQLSDALNRMIVDLRDRLRLRHSLDVAMEVQQRLLPRKPPTFPRLDVAGHSTYCDETGGDYYDFLILDQASPDSVLVALGDVMGHGVAAALVMAGARAVLRDRANTGGTLAELMTRLNRLLAADLEGTRFMTMHLSVVDARAGEFRWVSAGHDPAIIFDPASDDFQEIDGGELPLGIMDDTEYFEHSFSPLAAGQIILVGTDGLWESPDASGELFGKDRLRDCIRAAAAADKPAAEIVTAILDRLKTFRGDTRQVDDITFVVVRANCGSPKAGPQ